MRKLLLCFLCLSCLVSCEKENIFKVNETLLLGEWVYDHPEEGIWEKQKFIESGIFYYSNDVRGDFSFSNDQNNGSYRIISDNQVECSFYLHNVATTVTMTIQNITDYSYTAEYFNGESLGVFTYSKLLASYEMDHGEKLTLDYKSLVKTDILGYKSHNTNVIIVDDQTGEITAVAPGLSYVDVVTNEGTAVLEIIVADLWPDYSLYFCKTIEEIKSIYGKPDIETVLGVAYRVNNDKYIETLMFFVSSLYNTVDRVNITLKCDCDKDLIQKSLFNKYYFYKNDSHPSTGSFTMFYNKNTYLESTSQITYFESSFSINYMYLRHH